ncbi:hypothetical protein EG68_03777 [Paragonimus skrjabini miyazakii]|uniref:Endonuclease/exonuclease/phosphatase domain-containing protein n=1 Tax=Paragonimus skrjabini miyazakii TaxID=59628 RepID=A0A8S9Z805_9TREM|nr:hypothetical protein EG68_03777 [Paragonimus skrjabini miyazakii]
MKTHTNSCILDPPPRSINLVAVSAAYSKVVRRKHATADSTVPSDLVLRLLPTPISSELSVAPTTDIANRSNTVSVSPISYHRASGVPHPLVRSRMRIDIGVFNVRTLKQMSQQAALARTLDSLNVDVCCISETGIENSSQPMELIASILST